MAPQYLVTKEAIAKPIYRICLPFSLIFGLKANIHNANNDDKSINSIMLNVSNKYARGHRSYRTKISKKS